MIRYASPHITGDDMRAVVDVMRSLDLTQGKEVPRFEREVGKYVKAKHVVAFNSATSALYASYKALGMGMGTEVVTTPISYVATANAAKLLGANVYFQDRQVLTGRFVVPVHYSGRPVPFYGETVVEDASHTLGSYVDGWPVGSCRESDICVFSTHAIKNITTGEGGLATTNDGALADSLRQFRSHGWHSGRLRQPGLNLRMTDMQAALGRSQLKRIDSMRDQIQEVVNDSSKEQNTT
jgi:dTDP-4-amino-4,6-dideoxygalactose transaminase